MAAQRSTKEGAQNETTSSELNNSSDIKEIDVANSSKPPPPPNGGLAAWSQVAAAFLIFFNTWGMINTFAIFQTYYESGELFVASSSNISWIGSIQSSLLQLTGLVTGPIYDRGYLRLLLLTGSFMVVFGYMMLSLCTKYWQALLAQAFCVGIGGGLLFTPTVSLLPTWFSTHTGLAIGIASSGSSLGGVIYPIILYRLISQVGFPWAVRSMAFIALTTFVAPVAVMRMRVHPAKPRAMIDLSALRDTPFMLFTLSVLIVFIGNSVLIFYISFFPMNRGFTSTSLAFYMVAIFNAGSFLGRIVPNALSDRIGVFNTFAPITLFLGVTILSMLAVRNTAGMVVETVITGFLSGVVVALPPVCFGILTTNKSVIGTRIGQGFAFGGLGLLIGGPSAGAILGTNEPLNWTGLWIYGGVTVCIAGIVILVVRIMKVGSVLKVKA
jgi:MFS family permease